jgi:L-threonylcarbamoyladenylate synthase
VLVSAAQLDAEARAHAARGERVALLTLPADAAAAGRALYATLRALDGDGYDTIVATLPPDDEAHAAVRDRLVRAAAPREGA